MSSVFVNIGQFGNQIANELFDVLIRNKLSELCHVYSNGDGCIRSVHIDTEPKVLNKLTAALKTRLRPENISCGKRGRGSNWALGYYGLSNEPHLLEQATDSIRKEVERCSCFCGVVMFHSLSGGTGSGMGSRIIEYVRDEYPHGYIMNFVVCPHTGGESPLQQYNTVLCLDKLQKLSDAVILLDNDEALRHLSSQGLNQISMKQLNKHLAGCISGLIEPTDTLLTDMGVSTGMEPWKCIEQLCPQPALKMIHINHVESSTRHKSWKDLTAMLLQSVPREQGSQAQFRSQGNLLVARGDTTGAIFLDKKTLVRKMTSSYHCVEWNPQPVTIWTASGSYNGEQNLASLTCASNYSHVIPFLDSVTAKASDKFYAHAYWHWYAKYGCEEATFKEALDTVTCISHMYTDAVR